MPGVPGGGIRTVEDILARCRAVEGGCLIWAGACNDDGTPQAWFPLEGRVRTVGTILYQLKHPQGPKPGKRRYVAVCGDRLCMVHRQLRSVSKIVSGTHRNPALDVLKRTHAARARSKLTAEAVADIRASTDTGAACGRRHGITTSHVCRIRKGEAWAALPGGASVFSLGAA